MAKNEAGIKTRNSAIELLRIFAMIGVIILHYNNKDIGGALTFVEMHSLNYSALYYMEALTVAAVDIYVLITGYFMCDRDERNLFRPFELLFQVCFFKMLLYVVNVCLGQDFSIKTLIACLIPNNYFVVLYCALYLVSLLINRSLSGLSRAKFRTAVIILVLLFSVWPIGADILNEIMKKEYMGLSTIGMYGSESGYTIVTFVCLHTIAAYIRHAVVKLPSKRKCALVFLLLSIVEFIWIVGERSLFEGRYTATHYNNPVVIGLAVSAFCFFLQLKLDSAWINKLAGASFICFLIHQPFLKFVGIKEAVQMSMPIMIIHMLLCSIGIYLASYVVYIIYTQSVGRLLNRFKKIFPRISLSSCNSPDQ